MDDMKDGEYNIMVEWDKLDTDSLTTLVQRGYVYNEGIQEIIKTLQNRLTDEEFVLWKLRNC